MGQKREALPPPPPSALYDAARQLAARASQPAICQNVRFGTAGWADKELIASKLFYPKGFTSPEGRLAYYASQFGLVEVDSTFYTIFSPQSAEQWLARAPHPFLFNIKAFPAITGHQLQVARLPKDLREACEEAGFRGRVYPDNLPRSLIEECDRRFAAFLQPFLVSQRLGTLLVQFPPWFVATRGNARRIEALAEQWGAYPLAVEFRHPSWFDDERRERVWSLLTDLGISYVCADAPAGPRSALPFVAVTNPKLALLRFHGHNAAGWAKEGATLTERFNYLYSPEELELWVPRLRQLAERAENVHAIFNNGVRDYAILNAKGLSYLLDADVQAAPLKPDVAASLPANMSGAQMPCRADVLADDGVGVT